MQASSTSSREIWEHTMLTALAIRHIAFEDLGTLAIALNQCDIAITYVDAGADDLTQIDPLASDILIVLGGPSVPMMNMTTPF